MNLYYDPQKFGLTPVGEIEWSDGCYQFDVTGLAAIDAIGYIARREHAGSAL